MDDMVLVECVEPPTQPHEPKKVLDYHNSHTQHHVCPNKPKDRPMEGSTWENTSVMWKRHSNFIFKDKNSSTRGE